ncbi:MAG: hypothetical protein ACXABY_14065 [Candidatus Thorarchaeota archaeon]|jgi:DNA-directed RNA polymerase subunit RPC12/RpoP
MSETEEKKVATTYKCNRCGSKAVLQRWSAYHPMNVVGDPEAQEAASTRMLPDDVYWCMECNGQEGIKPIKD